MIPQKLTKAASAYDMLIPHSLEIEPGEIRTIGLRVKIQFPRHISAILHTKSSQVKLNAVFFLGGVIDSDYIGNIHIILLNSGKTTEKFMIGEAICQMKLYKDISIKMREGFNKKNTERGELKFGEATLRKIQK
ncbi:unnamed protein product [Owenia fusiformis]|uniref:Deoxyuridine 5'-triphosphate nucleotidohydrolase n=1 Tax=Owenia fusiformis TaxID=6347 RepID=A0A8S4NKQ3_OWEFU|nr:unnamed protein product [Owenia fusiformis]